MSHERILLDTDIVIHLLRKQPKTVNRFLRLMGEGATFLLSPIVVAEIYAGVYEREHASIEALFDLCQRIELDHETAHQAGHYAAAHRKSHNGISLEDYLLAASAWRHRCPLWTENRKHYPMKDIELLKGG